MWTRRWWIGTSSTERTESDFSKVLSRRSVRQARPYVSLVSPRDQHGVLTTILPFAPHELDHPSVLLALLLVLFDDRLDDMQTLDKRLQVLLRVDPRLLHVIQELLTRVEHDVSR